MRFSAAFIQQVRSSVTLSELVSSHVELGKRKGNNRFGLCPFHAEKTPSFAVDDAKGAYYCFGCHESGDAITWTRETQSKSFTEAVAYLAGLVGLSEPVEHEDPKIAAERRRAIEQEREAKRVEEERNVAKKHAHAASHASRVVKRCEADTHPYLARKGFPNHQGLTTPSRLDETKQLLVIPIFDGKGRIRSAQYINEDGDKKFHPGGEIKGNYHRIGHRAGGQQDVWLCEGYATGLSIWMALRQRSLTPEVRCCFSSGNMLTVGKDAIARRRSVYCVPDHDTWICTGPEQHRYSGNVTDRATCPHCGSKAQPPASERVAEALRRPYWLPPEVKTDANDYHQEHGLNDLAEHLVAFWRQSKSS